MINGLVPLDKFNSKRRGSFCEMNPRDPRPNGLACPQCTAELLDTNPCLTLLSYPPQKDVKCSRCWYRGHRVA